MLRRYIKLIITQLKAAISTNDNLLDQKCVIFLKRINGSKTRYRSLITININNILKQAIIQAQFFPAMVL